MRQNTKGRLQFTKLILRNVQEQNNKTWSKICEGMCRSNNLLQDLQSNAFKHIGSIYPNDLPRMKSSSVPKLHPSLVEEFELLNQKFVIEYREFYSKFTNMLAIFCKYATDTSCFDDVFSSSIMRLVNENEVDYLPTANAKGWETYTKEQFKRDYHDIIEQANFYLTARKLI